MNYYGRRRYYVRYPRRTYRRTWASTSRSKRRAIGNYRAAIKQQDKTDVNLNITTKFKAFQGTTLTFQNGVYALNIWDLLRKSDFYQSYANMYDQIKINSIRIKLTPIMFHTHQTTNVTGSTFYSSYTVVTAWDRTGLSENQLELNIDGNSKNSGKIGAAVTEAGLYIKMKGEDVATYSSAITKSMSPNSNTAIIRTLYPSTIAEKGLYINTADLEAWYEGYDADHVRYYGILNPEFVDGLASVTVPTVTQGQTVALKTPPYYLQTSQFYNKNPSTLHECPQFPFKPTLLVGLLNEAYTVDNGNGQNIRIEPLAEFNLEADIGVTFRGLRKAPIVTSPEIVNKIILEQLHYSVRLSDSKYVDEIVPLHTIPYVADTQQHSYDVYSHEIVLVMKYASNSDVVVHVFCNNTQVARNIKFDGPFWIKTINARDSLLDGTLALLAFEFTPYEDDNVFTFPWFKELQRNEFSYDTYIIKHNLYIMNFSTADIPDEPIQPESINLEEKQVTVTENGVTIVTPDLIEGYDALSSVEITTAVPSDVNNADVNTDSLITTNGTYSIPSGYTGFNNFEVALPIYPTAEYNVSMGDGWYRNKAPDTVNFVREYTVPEGYVARDGITIKQDLLYKSITSNGSYNIMNYRNSQKEVGWYQVDVNVPQGEMIMNALPGDNGVVTTNGQYNIPSGSTGFDSFTVNVPQTTVNNANVNTNSIIVNNGTFSIPSGYTGFNNFEVAIPIANERIINYTIDDQNYPNTNTTSTVNTTYPVPSGYQGQGNLTVPVKLLYKSITSNGTYSIVNNRSTNNELGFWKVDVNVPQESIQNSKTVNITQNTSQPLILTPDLGYDALRQIELNVNVPQTGVNSLEIYFVNSGVANHPMYDYMYTRNTSGSYIYLEPSQYAELWIQKSNGDVEFVVYYYRGTGSRYPLTNSTSCYYQVSSPTTSPPNTGDAVIFKNSVNGSTQLTINWYERYFSGTNMPGLYTASVTFPSALIGSTFRLPFFDN